MSDLPHLVPDWPAHPRVRAACTRRAGGVSSGPYASLNLALHVGDEPAAVHENRRRLGEALALPAEPVWLEQVHGNRVLRAEHANGIHPAGDGRSADAIVTRVPGVVCAIQVADCLPVLFAARDGSCVGAAHAGWRGLASGVLEATVEALGVPGRELLAWVGPGIGPLQFEVGEEVRAAFVESAREAEAAFAPNARGRWQCDLGRLACQRLAALGLADVSRAGGCTYLERESYYSFRRDGRCGRMAALIWLDRAA